MAGHPNTQRPSCPETVAFNRDLKPVLESIAQQEGVPLWVELLPPGPDITGRDGRRWVNDTPEAIVGAFEAHGADLPIDIEHASEIKGPAGEPAPAMGWIKGLEVREGGGIWGLVEWTEQGRWMVSEKSYRYLSPVFLFEKGGKTSGKTGGRILKLVSAGLTNQPNLHLTALNRDDRWSTPPKEADMALSTALCQALGLGIETSEAQAVAAITTLRSDLAAARTQADHPSLEKLVPRADYDAAIKRATGAEARLTAIERQARDAAIESAITQALERGKITPASAEYHRAQCSADGGLERFAAFVAAAPVIAGESGLEGAPAPGGAAGLSDEETAVCRQLNIPADEFAVCKQEDS